MELIVDISEPSQIVSKVEKLGIPFKVDKLPIGDFLYGNICIERKSISDFVTSLRAGHLDKQLMQMEENYEKNFLLISGTPEDLYLSSHIKNWTVEHQLGALAHLTRFRKIQVLQVANDNQLIKLVQKIITKQTDGKEMSIMNTELMMLKGKMTTADTKQLMLSCIPKVGRQKAKKLCNHLDVKITKKDGTEISDKYLKTIDGIGKGLAEHIMNINSNI